MKRIMSLIAVTVAAVTSLMACGKKASTEAAVSNQEAAPKVLVAYFSATGATKTAAEKVANATGAELFEIKPTEAYSAADLDWTVKTSRCGSGIENSEKVFKKAYPDVKWEAGKLLNGMSETEVSDWAKGYLK